MSAPVTVGALIIGAGMAGLACARTLSAAGATPLILDKGRGVGGRMATRRVTLPDGTEVSFDHGAQYMSARLPGFAALLEALPVSVARWDGGSNGPCHVARPGMSALPRAMAAGLDIRQRVTVTSVRPIHDGWEVIAGNARWQAAHVVITVPAPQVPALLGEDHPCAAALADVSMAPCLTLMAAFPTDAPRPFVARASDDHPLGWIAQDSTKPGRAGATATTWVAQARPDWSAAYLEHPPEAIAARMLPLLCAEIGVDPASALHASAHRWRYARVTEPLGTPFLRCANGRLWLGGDWCLGPRVSAAWQSGTTIARCMLEAGDVV